MSNNIVKHDQLKDIAGDLWTKAKARDIKSISYDKSSKKIKVTNAQTPALELEAELSNLASVDERAEFKKDVSVDSAGSINNLHIGRLSGAANLRRFSGCRGTTSKSFVDGYVSHLLALVDPALPVDEQTNWQVWAIKKGATRNDDVVLNAYHTSRTIQAPVKECTINNTTYKCAKITINEKFQEEVYFIVQCVEKEVRVITNIPPEHAKDVVNLSMAPPTTPGSHIVWTGYNAEDNMLALCLVGRESITSLAEKLRKTQADGIVTKVNNIAPGADGNVVVNADNIKYNADTNAKTVKAVLDEKVSNITLKANDKKKLEITKATGATTDVDLTEAFKANNVTYGKQIAGANKATVEDAIDALVAENGKSVKTIKNGRPDAQGNIDVTVAEGGATGITMTFGETGGTPVIVATYMTDQEVTAIKDLFV